MTVRSLYTMSMHQIDVGKVLFFKTSGFTGKSYEQIREFISDNKQMLIDMIRAAPNHCVYICLDPVSKARWEQHPQLKHRKWSDPYGILRDRSPLRRP